ncbi:MAG: plasmid recombination protein [Clostridia bacterium]|nr:plasmid recombination protein [Clostridia bacterium]
MSYLIAMVDRIEFSNLDEFEIEIERDPEFWDEDGRIDDAEANKNYHVIIPKGHYTELASPYVITDKRGREKEGYVIGAVVTAEEEFFDRVGEAMEKQFFMDAAQYFKDAYGELNVFSAVVHGDEEIPHMHVCFFPYDEEGKLTALGQLDEDALAEFENDIYENLGKRWKLDKMEESPLEDHEAMEEYRQAQIMYGYSMEVNDLIAEIEDKRKELGDITERADALARQEEEQKISLRSLQEMNGALSQENARLMKEIEKNTEFHAALDTAQAQDDPSRSKDETIRILKSREYVLQDQIAAGREQNKELLDTLKETENKLHEALKYKDKAQMADKILAMYPEEFQDLYYRSTHKGKSKPKGKDSKEPKDRNSTD